MAATDASELLRAGLLEGVRVLLARGAESVAGEGSSAGEAVHALCTQLGASVLDCRPLALGDPEATESWEQELERALTAAEAVDAIVIDCAGLYATASVQGARSALGACMQVSWGVTRTLANAAMIPGERGGRVLYLAPPPGAGEHAEPIRAGLENLARTLSIEWARHRITTVAIAPGEDTPADELAALTAYLCSPAGAYFSGCLLDLRGTR